MKTCIQFLNRIASYKTLLLLIAIYAIFPSYFLKNAEEKINQLSGKTIGVIDLTMGYNPERTKQMLNEYSAEARQYYASVEASVDVVYPLVYAFLFSVILILIFRKNRFETPVWIAILPFIAQIFDYIENFFIHSLLTNYPLISEQNVIFCEIAKLGKWLVFAGLILLIIYGLSRLLITKIQK